jgi:hypothetical protein
MYQTVLGFGYRYGGTEPKTSGATWNSITSTMPWPLPWCRAGNVSDLTPPPLGISSTASPCQAWPLLVPQWRRTSTSAAASGCSTATTRSDRVISASQDHILIVYYSSLGIMILIRSSMSLVNPTDDERPEQVIFF